MVKNDILSATKANRFYWLGRYVERVYMTLHVLNKCYDKMIDGEPDDYMSLWSKLDITGAYNDNDEFVFGMMYDLDNPSSVLSSLESAKSNAILLREDIMSETLSYIEMSVALVKRCKEKHLLTPVSLQSVIDWSLAFWGSAEQRLQNHKALAIMQAGRNVENIDMKLRFGYSFRRISLAYESLGRYSIEIADEIDSNIKKQIDAMIDCGSLDSETDDRRSVMLKYINRLVRV
ncbi:MAG: alpha-E domain-containing protein [Prevotella sp.]